MAVFWNGKHVTLCQIVVSYAENGVFKMWHFELQNVRKAENVCIVLETWEEVLLSVCQFKYLCYACYFSVLAAGKNCNN